MENITIPSWLPYLLLAIAIISKILNKATTHFSEHKGFVKVALFIVDILDIFKSSAPVAKKPRTGTFSLVPFALAAGITLSGCATLGVVVGAACKLVPVAQVVHTAICDSLKDGSKEKQTCSHSKEIAEKAIELAKSLPVKHVEKCE